jgi:hypothetical protein
MGDAAGIVRDKTFEDLDARLNPEAPGEVDTVETNLKTKELTTAIQESLAFTKKQKEHILDHWLGDGPGSWFQAVPAETRREILRQGFLRAIQLKKDSGLPIETQWICSRSTNAEPRFEVGIVVGKHQITVLLLCEPTEKPPAAAVPASPSFVVGHGAEMDERWWRIEGAVRQERHDGGVVTRLFGRDS